MTVALTGAQLALMDTLVCQWDAPKDNFVVAREAEADLQVLCDRGLLERVDMNMAAVWRERLSLAPYSALAVRPRPYSLFRVDDPGLCERWALHADICRGLEECDQMLWSLVLVSPDKKSMVTVESVNLGGQTEVRWLGGVLPTLLSAADELRAEAYAWADARRAREPDVPRPDWRAIACEGLRRVQHYLHADTVRALRPKRA